MQNSIAALIEKVEAGSEFAAWRKKNGSAYLTSAFLMAKSAEQASESAEWLLSYYDEGADTFTTFSANGRKMAGDEQAFKKGETLPGLDAASAKIGIKKALAISEAMKKEKCKGEETRSVVAILQPLTESEIYGKGKPKVLTVWNITYITSSFNVLNVKVDALTGKALADSVRGVMDFMQKDK